jgi:hypothetical protein
VLISNCEIGRVKQRAALSAAGVRNGVVSRGAEHRVIARRLGQDAVLRTAANYGPAEARTYTRLRNVAVSIQRQ